MNEPAIFYSEKHLKEVFDQLEEYRNQNLDIRSFFEFCGLVQGIPNNEEDYRSFYHNYRGERIRHDKVHNLRRLKNWSRAAGFCCSPGLPM